MGLTIHFELALPKKMTWKQGRAIIEDARVMAKSLPGVLQVSDELTDVNTHQEPLDAPVRFIDNPWCYAASARPHQCADRWATFHMNPGYGCESVTFGIESYRQYTCKPEPLRCQDGSGRFSNPVVPNFRTLLLDGPPVVRNAVKNFMRQFKLRLIPRPATGMAKWHSWTQEQAVYACSDGGLTIAKAGFIKGPYTSHRQGYGPDRPVLHIDGGRTREDTWFKFDGVMPEHQWMALAGSKPFRDGLKTLLEGDVHVEPPAITGGDFCKTEYAANPLDGGYGLANFVRCHLAVCTVLGFLADKGLVKSVRDETGFWESRDLGKLCEAFGAPALQADTHCLACYRNVAQHFTKLLSTHTMFFAMSHFMPPAAPVTPPAPPEPVVPIERPERDIN